MRKCVQINRCLEGGAEEFLLKPVQLSDLEKLQHYLLKSIDHSSSNESTTSIHHHQRFTGNDVVSSADDDHNDDDSRNNVKENNNNNKNNNSNIVISKRKAVSPEPSERRPRVKGLADIAVV